MEVIVRLLVLSKQFQRRVFLASGVSPRTEWTIIAEKNNIESGESTNVGVPGKKRPRTQMEINFDDFNLCTLRRIDTAFLVK
jgi:hypothetical protein